jgi:hypothetical protein
MLRSIAARQECRCFHCRTALRCVSKHEGKGIARLILRDGAARLLRMRLAKTRAPRWLVRSLFFLFFCRHRSRVYPRSAPNVRKSGKPDLRGPFQSVTVPDQRCTASRCTASGTRVIDCRIAFPSHQLNQSTLLRSRGAFVAPGLCIFASPTRMRGGRSAERRSGACEAPVGRAVTRHARRLRGALRLMTRDARLSALHRGGFRLPGPRFSPRYRPRLALRPAADRSQRAPRSQVVVPGGRGPYLPGQRLQAAAAGRHASLRLQDRL